MNTLQTTGIVLKEYNFSEADKLFIVFTKNRGKITCTAQGIRKSRSKMRGFLQLFSYSSLHLYHGKVMYKVIGGEIINAFPNIKEDLLIYSYANYITEILNNILPNDEPNKRVFVLTVSIFHLMGVLPLSQLSSIFILKLLKHTGFLPELFKCLKCRQIINKPVYFSYLDGGCVCCSCGSEDQHNEIIPANILKIMQRLLTMDLETAERLKLNLKDQLAVEEILNRYLEGIIEKSLNSRNFIKELQSTDGYQQP